MFYKEGNGFDTFVRPQRYTKWVLVSNTECKHNFSLSTRKTHRAAFTDTQREGNSKIEKHF